MPIRCAASRLRSSSRMISISLAIITSGSSTVALAVAKSMIRSANWWRASSAPRRASASRISARSSSTVVELADALRELVVQLGQDPLAQVEQGHLEVGVPCPAAPRPGSHRGRSMSKPFVLADLHPDQVLLPAGDHPVLADHQRQPIGRCRPRTARRRSCRTNLTAAMSPFAAPTLVDRPQRGLLLAQLGDDRLDLLVGHLDRPRG